MLTFNLVYALGCVCVWTRV